jgi:hypothetical protein
MARMQRLKRVIGRWRENTRSLIAGEDPRRDRRFDRVEPSAYHVSVTGVAVGCVEHGEVLLVDVVGDWSLVELDDTLFPLGAESAAAEAQTIVLSRDALDVIEEMVTTQQPVRASSVVAVGGELLESSVTRA